MIEHPQYPWAQRLKRTEGRALMARHGAHSLGIGSIDGEPALVFYVEDAPVEPVPAELVVQDDSGRTVAIRTRVVVSPPASFE